MVFERCFGFLNDEISRVSCLAYSLLSHFWFVELCYNVTLFVCGFSLLLCFLLLHVAVVYVEHFGRLFNVPVFGFKSSNKVNKERNRGRVWCSLYGSSWFSCRLEFSLQTNNIKIYLWNVNNVIKGGGEGQEL